jgi:hypothetical protein
MRYRGLPREVASGPLPTAGLWVAAVRITAVMLYSIVLTLKSLG